MATRPRIALDRIDLRILALLQAQGRLTHQKLADEVSLSARACLDRVRRLERSGLIAGYHARVDVKKLGGVVTVTALVTLKDLSRSTQSQFEQRMRDCPQVITCFEVSGRFDYVVRVACDDLEHYRSMTSAWADDSSLGIARIESNPELSTVKEFVAYPMADEPAG